jgi:predicted HAD superfamily Cof-like phosphohydrolase
VTIDQTREAYVSEFHKAMGMERQARLSVPLLQLRMSLIQEEMLELKQAVDSVCAKIWYHKAVPPSEVAHILKELVDCQYVISGFADAFGLPMQPAFIRVHKSNMSKLEDGKPVKREDGKVLKGKNYTPPNLIDLVE